MTLIAAINREYSTFLIGDALITTGANVHADVPLPTVELPNEIGLPGIFIAGMCRKFFPITPQIYLGWSGEMENLKRPLRRLRSLCKPGNHEPDQIISWHKRSRLSSANLSTILVAATKPDGRIIIEEKANTFKVPGMIGETIVAGSGASSFYRDYINNKSIQSVSDPQALFYNCASITTRIIAHQKETNYGLSQAFGGIFDLMSVEDYLVRPVSNVLYIYKKWCHIDDGIDTSQIVGVHKSGPILSTIDNAYYISHVNDDMFVARWRPGGPICFLIRPPFSSGKLEKFPIFSKIDMVIETIFNQNGLDTITRFTGSQGYAVNISQDRCSLDLSEKFSDDMISELLALRNGDSSRFGYTPK